MSAISSYTFSDPDSEPPIKIRKTQRAPKRCNSCAQRRIRCDGAVPCSECTTRGNGHLCRRETVIVKGRVVASGQPSIRNELSSLSKDDLLGQILSLEKEVERLKRNLENPKGAKGAETRGEKGGEADKAEKAAKQETEQVIPITTAGDELGKMARMLGLIPESDTLDYDGWEAEGIDPLMTFPEGLSVPFNDLSKHLIDYVFDDLGFLICPIPISIKLEIEIIRQMEAAPHGLQELPLQYLLTIRPAWTALYLSLLAAALVYVRPERAMMWGVLPENKLGLARTWYRAAFNAMLSGAACLARPSLTHLQTFCVLTLLFQPFDCMALHDTWLASMLQSARRLGLHRLRNRPLDRTPAGEIGRRIWAFLLSREVHYTGEDYCASVSRAEPGPFATFLNIDEPTVVGPPIELPLSQPTRVSYLMAGSRVTAFTRDLKNLPLDTPYEEILRLDSRLKKLFDDMDWLHEGADLTSYPPWVSIARHVIALKVCQRRLYLHRQYFALTASHDFYAPSRKMSLEAATDICNERSRFDLPFDDKLDTINGILPAAIVLLLDAIYPLPTQRTKYTCVLDRCHQIEQLLAPIRSTTYTSSSKIMSKTLAAVDSFLADTLQAAEAVELAQNVWNQSLTTVNDATFSAALDEFSFESLLDGFEKDWSIAS